MNMKETIKKKPITDEQIQAWVTEAEQGYDVAALKKAGRGRPGRAALPSQVVAVRLTAEELALLDSRAKDRHLTRSELIREVLFA